MNGNYPLVSIIVVNYNGKHLLKDCFDSLRRINYPKDKLEIFMVDNCSIDGSVKFIRESYPEIKIIGNNINNYCRANNLGIRSSTGEYAALLNSDTKVDKNWLMELVKVISNDNKIAAVGSKIVFDDGRIQSVGHVEFPNYYWGDDGFLEEDSCRYNQVQEVKSISNCSALYRIGVFDKVGFFDEDFEMYMEDVDIAFRMRKEQWKILYVPDSVVCHCLHGSGLKKEEQKFYVEKNRLLFIAKYFPEKLPDLFYGSGEILRLKYSYFQCLLVSLLNKLIKLYGDKEAARIFSEISGSVRKTQDFDEHSLRTILESRDIQVIAKDKQINDLASRVVNLEEQLKNSQQAQSTQDQHIKELTKIIGAREEQIKNQDAHLRNLQQAISGKDQEISNIYNSETYRFIIRLFLWPVLSFIKRIGKAYKKIFNKLYSLSNVSLKKTGIFVAQFYANNIEVAYKQKNEYFIRLVNKKFREKGVKLVFDIWPYVDRSHPKRHFCYFVSQIAIKPLGVVDIKVNYNWEKEAVFFIDGKEEKPIDIWRGTTIKNELYILEVLLYDSEEHILDRLSILQKLKI